MVESPGLSLADQYALSPLQQGMLFHSLDAAGGGVDVEHVLCSLSEPLHVAAFVEAWERVVARYDVLRTSFEWEARGEPVQNVYNGVQLPVQVVDWRDLAADEQRLRLADLLAADRRRGFDLTRAPLMRLTIVTRSPSAVEVLWSFHHAILDGRSFPIVLREVFGLYDAIRVGQEIALPPPRQYRAYIDWLQSSGPEDSKEFWRQRLAGFTGPTPILRA